MAGWEVTEGLEWAGRQWEDSGQGCRHKITKLGVLLKTFNIARADKGRSAGEEYKGRSSSIQPSVSPEQS